MTIKLRLHASKHHDQASGRSFELKPGEDPELDYVVEHGHEYIILDETVTNEEAELISDWYNSDQDQNNASTEASLMRLVQQSCRSLMKQSVHVNISSIVQQVRPGRRLPEFASHANTRDTISMVLENVRHRCAVVAFDCRAHLCYEVDIWCCM